MRVHFVYSLPTPAIHRLTRHEALKTVGTVLRTDFWPTGIGQAGRPVEFDVSRRRKVYLDIANVARCEAGEG